MRTSSSAVHLTLQQSKFEFLPPTQHDVAVPSVLLPLAVSDGAVHHSIPFGSPRFIYKYLTDLLAEHRRRTDSVLRLPDSEAQTALVLLRFCCGPRLSYWLRSLPFLWAAWLAGEADRSSYDDLARLVDSFGVPHESLAGGRLRSQLALLPRKGGLGLCGRQLVVASAQVAAWSDTLRLLGSSFPHLTSLRATLCQPENATSTALRTSLSAPSLPNAPN